MRAEVPVEPDAEQARDWLARELVDPAYREAEPNWFDSLVSSVLDWLGGLLGAGTGSPPVLLLVIAVVVVAGLVLAAYLVFGAPRANRRSRLAGTLFGDDDERDAQEIRRAASDAAARGDWDLAIQETFRSIARLLTERAILTTTPGTTASGFAMASTPFFPDLADGFARAADDFDAVRYLGRRGSSETYAGMEELERAVRSRRPVLETVGTEAVTASSVASVRG